MDMPSQFLESSRAPLQRPKKQGLSHFRQKLVASGMDGGDADEILRRVEVISGIRRDRDIVAFDRTAKHATVLLEGMTCLYGRLPDGSRQIFAFQHPGDFCDLSHAMLPATSREAAVCAVTGCTIGIIDRGILEQLLVQYPSLMLAMWRAAMLEASILRKRMLNIGRQPALQRIAHLLCEQVARQESVGIGAATLPLRQIDIADAAALSIVHVSRTCQQLQKLGLLSKEGHRMKVVDRKRLADLAAFDGDYLDMPQLLLRWQVRLS